MSTTGRCSSDRAKSSRGRAHAAPGRIYLGRLERDDELAIGKNVGELQQTHTHLLNQ